MNSLAWKWAWRLSKWLSIAITLVSILMDWPPFSWINRLMTEEPGGRGQPAMAAAFTLLLLQMPMVVISLVLKLQRSRRTQAVDTDESGVWFYRVPRFRNSLEGIPIFVNGTERDVLDVGQRRFIPLLPGTYEIKAGLGWQTSELLTLALEPAQQVRVKMSMVNEIVTQTVVLEVVEPEPVPPPAN